MSVKDYNKIFTLKNMTTGEIMGSIHHNLDYPCYGEHYVEEIFVKVKLGDLKLLDYIHDCIDEGHGCLISVGYEPEKSL